MKISLALKKAGPLNRQDAWACLTANLGMPGFGSLLAGRKVGYPQSALCILGLTLTLIYGVRFIQWSLANWSLLHDPDADPLQTWNQIVLATRWPLLSIGVFFVSWIWALGTSLTVLRQTKADPGLKPPPLFK